LRSSMPASSSYANLAGSDGAAGGQGAGVGAGSAGARSTGALGNGSVVELDRLAGEPVDVLVNDQLIARGEVVIVDESFGVRITEIVRGKQ